MFDRILYLIDTCSSGFDRKLVDDAVTRYVQKGGTAAEQFLVQEKGMPQEQAIDLVLRIDRQNHRLSRQAFFISVLLLGFALLILYAGLSTTSYFFMVIGGLLVVIALMQFRKKLRRFLIPRYSPTGNGLHQKDPGH